MITQEAFLKLFTKLCLAFSKEYSSEQREIYYEELKHLTEKKVALAMKSCIGYCKFFPTVADILSGVPKHYHELKRLEAGQRVPMPKYIRDMIKNIGRSF